MTVGVRFCSSKLGLDSVDVVKENFSTSNSTAREPGLKRVIAESSSPKNHNFFLSSPPHCYCHAELQFHHDPVTLSSLIEGKV